MAFKDLVRKKEPLGGAITLAFALAQKEQNSVLNFLFNGFPRKRTQLDDKKSNHCCEALRDLNKLDKIEAFVRDQTGRKT